jgi:hypothetical protein
MKHRNFKEYLQETVIGKSIYHCHGKDKGKKIATLSSHKKALAMHAAIEINKHKKDK